MARREPRGSSSCMAALWAAERTRAKPTTFGSRRSESLRGKRGYEHVARAGEREHALSKVDRPRVLADHHHPAERRHHQLARQLHRRVAKAPAPDAHTVFIEPRDEHIGRARAHQRVGTKAE